MAIGYAVWRAVVEAVATPARDQERTSDNAPARCGRPRRWPDAVLTRTTCGLNDLPVHIRYTTEPKPGDFGRPRPSARFPEYRAPALQRRRNAGTIEIEESIH
jgi:hypothetical protein